MNAPEAEPPAVDEDDIMAIMGDTPPQATATARAPVEDPANHISSSSSSSSSLPPTARFRPSATPHRPDRTVERSGYQMFSHQAAKISWIAPVIAFVLTS